MLLPWLAGVIPGDNHTGLMLLASLPSVFAIVLFVVFLQLQKKGKPKWLKWLSLLPLVLGVILGYTIARFMFVGDEVYRRYYVVYNRKPVYLHYAVFFTHFLTIGGLVVWGSLADRRQRDEGDDLKL